MLRNWYIVLACALILVVIVQFKTAIAEDGKLSVELNKFEPGEGACRTFFLFRNRTQSSFKTFELSLAILNRKGVIDRLLTVNAAPLPAQRTTLKLFEIPDTVCDQIGEIIMHEIAQCEADDGQPVQCYDIIELRSLAGAPLLR